MTRTSFGDQLQQMWRTRPARLPRNGPIAGVAAGVGHRYGVDPVLVRVAFVVSTIFGGAGIVLYLAGWLLFPEPGAQASMAESLTRRDSQNQTKTIVLIVALAIAVSTMGPVGVGLGGSGIVSLALMLAGWWMLYLRAPEPPPLPDGTAEPQPFGAPGTTGYPGIVFPQGPADPYTAHVPGVYTPYTKLPDRYEPADPAATPAPDLGRAAPEPARTADTPAGPDPALSAEPPVRPVRGSAVPGTPAPAEAGTPATGTPDPTGTAVPASPGDRLGDSTAGQGGSPDSAQPGPDPAASHTSGAGTSIDMSKPGDPLLTQRTPPSWDPLGVAPLAWDLPAPAPARTVAPTADEPARSRFTPIVVGLAVLAAAGAGAAAAAGAEWMTPARIAAVALAVIGLGLVVGAFRRRGHGLLLVTAPLAAFVLLAAAVGPVDMRDSTMGERTWAPAASTELRPDYTVTMGSGTLDLRGIELTENKTVDLSVQMGQAMVLLPENMNVRTDCTVRMGEARCPDGLTGPGGDAPVLDLHVRVRMGEAEVRRG
ncbi:PspC domain-containing protein [Nocardia sp. X0981]